MLPAAAPPLGRRVLGSHTEEGGDSVQFWKSQIQAAQRQWEDHNGEDRERLRRMISDIEFPFLMVRSEGGVQDDKTLRRLNPSVDQIDMNLGLRWVQKLASNIGDEEPEVKWNREWTGIWERIAYKWDRLIQRYMEMSGAPENNAEAAADIGVDGITTFWVGLSYGLGSEDLLKASESVDEIIKRILRDPDGYEAAPGSDHELIAETLEARAFDVSTGMRDPTGVLQQALLLASSRHYAAAAKEDKKGRIDWRYDRLQITHERLPYGTHALMDPVATSFRSARWVARLLRYPVEEARSHPSFHPGIRRQLQPDLLEDRTLQHQLAKTWQGLPEEQLQTMIGLCSIWEISDRKTRQIIYLNLNMDRFLNAGKKGDISRMRHPFLDPKGRPIIKPVTSHPGFFPCDVLAPQVRQKDDAKKKLANPMLKPGLKLLLALTKVLSHYVGTVKRASSALYEAHPKLTATARRAIKNGIDGTIFTRPADVEPGQTVMPVQWKPPSETLYRLISDLINYWCMIQSFPLGELTTKPVADTASQEEMGLMAGDIWMMEIVRKFEVSYGVQAHIFASLMMYFTTREDWAELVGKEDAAVLYDYVRENGLPQALPSVRYASKRRDMNPVRVKQILDFDERLAADIDPLTMMPKWERSHLLQEAARALNLGKLSRYQPDQEQLRRILEAKGRALAERRLAELEAGGGEGGGGEGGAPARGGPPTNGNGQPSAPGGNSGTDRPAVGGSPGGSASQDRPEKRRRGGRRGRSAGPGSMGNEMTDAMDIGPQ